MITLHAMHRCVSRRVIKIGAKFHRVSRQVRLEDEAFHS